MRSLEMSAISRVTVNKRSIFSWISAEKSSPREGSTPWKRCLSAQHHVNPAECVGDNAFFAAITKR